jgi:response regulator RpfG family c-di-GMP phosphodiesterase
LFSYYYRLWYASNVRNRFIKKIREKDTTFKLKIILISAFIKSNIMSNDISDSLRIDKIIEKPIHLENLIEEVQKLTTVIN